MEKLKDFLESYFEGSSPQTFYCHSSDPTTCIYSDGDIKVYENSYYEYIDIIGLTDEQQTHLESLGYN